MKSDKKEYEIISIPPFERQLKRLAKKYASIKNEIETLKKILAVNPEYGTALGNGCFKIRLAIKSKGQGKSGGARVITYFYVTNKQLVLLSIYDKSEQANISDADMKSLLDLF